MENLSSEDKANCQETIQRTFTSLVQNLRRNFGGERVPVAKPGWNVCAAEQQVTSLLRLRVSLH